MALLLNLGFQSLLQTSTLVYETRGFLLESCGHNATSSLVVSTDGSWLNISKFIGNQLRATSYRIKRAECYKVVADTPDSTVTYEYEIDVPMTDATPEPLPSIPAQLSLLIPGSTRRSATGAASSTILVQPAPRHQPPIASDEKMQDSADEQDYPTEQLPRRSTRIRKPPDYLRF